MHRQAQMQKFSTGVEEVEGQVLILNYSREDVVLMIEN